MCISTDTVVRDTGLPDPSAPDAAQVPIPQLILFQTTRSTFLSRARHPATAIDCSIWRGRCSAAPSPGWARVQAINDFVHQRIVFGYEHARVRPISLASL